MLHAAAKTTPARRLPAADEDTAARAAATARLAEKIKPQEAKLKAAQGPDSKRTSAAAKAAAAATNARGRSTPPASNNDSSDTESDGDAEGDEASQGGSEGDAEELARQERETQVAELLALLEEPAAP
jgi:hypothetical protein